MDAIKLMTEGMLKAEKPVVNIGDTVKKAKKKEFRFLKVSLSPKNTVVFPKLSQLEKQLTA